MKTFHIQRSSGIMETVQADYSKVQDGHLYFRMFRTERNGYPELVKVFAPGSWLTLYESSMEEYVRTSGSDDEDIPF